MDVERLTTASAALASVADTIKSTKANYVPAAVQLLIEANDVIIAMRDRGLRPIANYLQKHGGPVPRAFTTEKPDAEQAREDQPAAAGWPGADRGD